MENTSARNRQTANSRLADLIEELNTTDTIIAKEIAKVRGKSWHSVTGVTSLVPGGGNKIIKNEFLEDFGKAFPFLNIDWIKSGLGDWLADWSPVKRSNYITKSEWYKNQPADSLDTADPCSSKKHINELLKTCFDTNFKIILRRMWKSTYATGSELRSDINKELCHRIKKIRLSRNPMESQTYFAETTMDEKRYVITNIESWRQNPQILFISKLKDRCSISVDERLSYDWLLDGVGEMYIDQRNLPYPAKPGKNPEKINKELCKRIDNIREEIGMKKTEFAKHLNVNRAMVSSIAFERQNPTTWFLSRLKEKCSQGNKIISYDWLLDGVGEKFIQGQTQLDPTE